MGSIYVICEYIVYCCVYVLLFTIYYLVFFRWPCFCLFSFDILIVCFYCTFIFILFSFKFGLYTGSPICIVSIFVVYLGMI